jgi:hypothetical protein
VDEQVPDFVLPEVLDDETAFVELLTDLSGGELRAVLGAELLTNARSRPTRRVPR